ncbi:selenocysteine insertion sequence-binding protein 2 isoform X2 [Amia ocellicauda]|uniref:selenocysteine insertion sequence-binding protein 2 isoform X2 n=1 Tax=Amia ocellicauda TaxID=2972642 RepID=UPI003463FD6D
MKPETRAPNRGSKLSPDVEPFIPKHILKESKPDTTAFSYCTPSSFLVNEPGLGGLCTLKENLTEGCCLRKSPLNWKEPYSPLGFHQHMSQKSTINEKQRPQFQNEDNYQKKYSSTRRIRKTDQEQGEPSFECTSRERPREGSRPNTEPDIQKQKLMRTTFEESTIECRPNKSGNRSKKDMPKSAEKSKPQSREADRFEVTLADFPQLESPASHDCSVLPAPWSLWASAETSGLVHKQCATLPAFKKEARTPPLQCNSVDDEVVLATPLSSQVQPTVPTSQLSACSASSWARIASQPPRKPTLKNTTSQEPLQNTSQEKSIEGEREQSSEKKKKKRKKKKPKQPCSTAGTDQSETPIIIQEPPKFEDEMEFPDLAIASASPGKTHSPATQPPFSSSNRTKKIKELSEHKVPASLGSTAETAESCKDRGKDQSVTCQPLPHTTEVKKGQKTEKTSGKKSKVPVQLDLGNMLEVLEQKQKSQQSKRDPKPIVLSVGGSLPVVPKDPFIQKKHVRQPEKVAHNPLDSTCPLVKKGKQREVPKAKKPTPLKRIILKEREERKQRRLQEEQGLDPPPQDFVSSTDQCEDPFESKEAEQDHDNSADSLEETTTMVSELPAGNLQVEDEEPDLKVTEEAVFSEAQLVSIRPKIHSRKFREYCSQVLSKEVDNCVVSLLKELVRFQDRLYQKDPMKARMKRRLVMGLREVLKHLKLRKLKCVIISPNCERIESKGGLDEALHTIIETCREQNIPFVFALSRKALGRCVNKAVPVSLVGIFSYDGAQDYYHKMIELSSEARIAYEEMIASLEKADEFEGTQELPVNQPALSSSDLTQHQPETEEPEYIKMWKKMLEKECNHQFLNFEEQVATMNSESRLHVDGTVDS